MSAPVRFKRGNFSRGGSFKFPGAMNAVFALDTAVAEIIAHSFGQSLFKISPMPRRLEGLRYHHHAKQSEMPIRTFFSAVPAARGPSFEEFCGNRTVKLAGRTGHPSLRQASSRGPPIGSACPPREFSKKGTVSGTGPGFIREPPGWEESVSRSLRARSAEITRPRPLR